MSLRQSKLDQTVVVHAAEDTLVGAPVASCLEWHGDSTAGEDDRTSHLAAVAPARRVRPVQMDASLVGKPGGRGS